MKNIVKIKKRNGNLEDFKKEKITSAVQKAFAATRKNILEEELHSITDHVVKDLENRFSQDVTPMVENVQDLVEKEIMARGYFDVAKAYIIYRFEHAKIRQEKQKEILKKIEKNTLSIVKRSGKKEPFSIEKIKKTLKYASKDFNNPYVEAIAKQCESEIYENISTDNIAKALVLSMRSWIERDPMYSIIASRLLRNNIYREAFGEKIQFSKFQKQYKDAFIKNIKKAVDFGRLDERMLNFDLEKLASSLKPERDDMLKYLGMQTLSDRYFLQNQNTQKILETPQAFWMRVAMGIALLEKEKDSKAIEFYEVMSNLRFTPSTPTLFHAGTRHPQLSSCYLTTITDSLENIFKSIGDNAQLSKWSGGVANDWTNIRGTGATIKGTGVESQGVIPFLKIANDTTVAINRSGRRRGATCAYLETWHYDIEDFLELKKNTGDERRRTHDMNTANWIPDLFMKRVKEDGEWTLFSSEEVSDLHHLYGKKFEERYRYYEAIAKDGKINLFKKVKARDLWKKMITMLFETGHPWITFKDPSNVRSPQAHVGIIHSSNLCTEITLNTSAEETAVCNLGSINLANHIDEKNLNIEILKETIAVAMRMLDNVIDINYYPTKEAKFSNLRHRPVGLGIMGFQDALYRLDIPFDSKQAIDFADKSMEIISYYAILASSNLAKERGKYETYQNSKWEQDIFPIDTLKLLEKERGESIEIPRTFSLDWSVVRENVRLFGMRNSNCLAIAPTATISNIVGCFPSIEPIYKNIYVKSNMSGEFTIVNEYLINDLKKLNLWNDDVLEAIKRHDGNISEIPAVPRHLKEKYKETFDIDPEWLIKIAAYRGKWIDQSQSLNIFYRGTSGKKMSDAYFLAWSLGLKTTYYLRTLGASGIEKSTIDLKKKSEPVSEASLVINNIALCKINDPTCESCQ